MGEPRGDEARARTEPAESPQELRSERSIALVRLLIVALVGAVYVSSLGIQRTLGPLAMAILALAAFYALWVLLARPYQASDSSRFIAGTLLVDTALITLWVHATGGPASEFWSLYLIAVISAAIRFDLVEVLAVGAGMAVVYVVVMTMDGGLPATSALSRPGLMVLTGFAVGVLARERRVGQARSRQLELLAEERREALVQEQATVERLRRVDLAKTEFVSIASHEFRTPLAAILGVISTIRTHGDQLEPEVREELLDAAQLQAKRLARLVDDLLTVSRIEDGALALRIEQVHPQRLIFEAAQAARVGTRLAVELVGVQRVRCDVDRVVRVLTNLLDNAKKFSPEAGRISVIVTEDEDWVRFAVRDQGPGVPDAERAAVFERFRQLTRRPDTGSGLGLYIARSLVEAHGGSIVAEEAPGGGAEFAFTLPKLRPAGEALREGELDGEAPSSSSVT